MIIKQIIFDNQQHAVIYQADICIICVGLLFGNEKIWHTYHGTLFQQTSFLSEYAYRLDTSNSNVIVYIKVVDIFTYARVRSIYLYLSVFRIVLHK